MDLSVDTEERLEQENGISKTCHNSYPRNIVDFDGPDDPHRPVNWPLLKKLIHTALYGMTTMTTPWASSVYSPAMDAIAEHFHVSKEVAIVGLSLCLLE